MNKHSKYRELLGDVKQQICRAEVGVTGVYQLMLQTLDKADKEERSMQVELASANAHIAELREALNDYSGETGIEHSFERLLSKTRAQSLAEIQAKAIMGLIDVHSRAQSIDGIAWMVINQDDAYQYIDKLIRDSK